MPEKLTQNRAFLKTVVGLLALLWLAANALTLTAYPAPWVDELLFADPAIHLLRGQGFVSSAWFNQPSTEFWANYPPMYTVTLAAWLAIFGISEAAVRSFGFTMLTASLAIIGVVLKRIAYAPRITIVAALALGEPLLFVGRQGRPDSFSILLFALTALAFVQPKSHWRTAALFLTGALALPAALQYAAFVLVIGGLLQVWFRLFDRRDILTWLAGAACGTACLASVYASKHVLRIAIQCTLASKHSSAGRFLQHVLLHNKEQPFVFSTIVTAPFRDTATPIILLAALIIWLVARRIPNQPAQKTSSFAAGCAVLIPLSIQLLGQYRIYYTYMGYIPATVACFVAVRQLSKHSRLCTWVILVLVALGGAGQFWLRSFIQGTGELSPATLGQFAKTDGVISDYPAYYQLLKRVPNLFGIDYAGGKALPHLPEGDSAKINKIIVRDSRFEEVRRKVGGNWQRSGEATFVMQQLLGPARETNWAAIDDDVRDPRKERLGIYFRKP